MEHGSSLYEAVREHYLFAGLEEEAFDRLVESMSIKHLTKGEVLFHRGDNADAFYFIDTGLVELTLIAPSGEKKTLEVIGPGRTFGEAVAFMRGHRFPVSAEVLEDTALCQIPNQAYIEMLQSNPGACMRLLADISTHLHARVREIEHLTIQNARSRLISYLLDHVVETTDKHEATVRLNLPRHVIASRLSITPETLSRLLRNLTDEGLISTEDRIVFIHRLSDLRLYD
jgi:CRP-like cAMP-binding protein